MSKFELKQKVQTMRKNGFSIGDICKQVNISRSTASIWCRDILLTKKQHEILRQKMLDSGNYGRVKGARINKEKKEARVKKARDTALIDLKRFCNDPMFLFGIGLYWAEGSKRDNKFVFSNSDPFMISCIIRWLNKYFNVQKDELMPRLYVNQLYKKEIPTILTFWETLLKLPPKQFGKPVLLRVRNKKVYNNRSEYKGLISLRVKNSTYLMHRVVALINEFKNSLSG